MTASNDRTLSDPETFTTEAADKLGVQAAGSAWTRRLGTGHRSTDWPHEHALYPCRSTATDHESQLQTRMAMADEVPRDLLHAPGSTGAMQVRSRFVSQVEEHTNDTYWLHVSVQGGQHSKTRWIPSNEVQSGCGMHCSQ